MLATKVWLVNYYASLYYVTGFWKQFQITHYCHMSYYIFLLVQIIYNIIISLITCNTPDFMCSWKTTNTKQFFTAHTHGYS